MGNSSVTFARRKSYEHLSGIFSFVQWGVIKCDCGIGSIDHVMFFESEVTKFTVTQYTHIFTYGFRPSFGTLGQIFKILFRSKSAQCRGPQLFCSGILISLLLSSPCKISEPCENENPLRRMSKEHRKEQREKKQKPFAGARTPLDQNSPCRLVSLKFGVMVSKSSSAFTRIVIGVFPTPVRRGTVDRLKMQGLG